MKRKWCSEDSGVQENVPLMTKLSGHLENGTKEQMVEVEIGNTGVKG